MKTKILSLHLMLFAIAMLLAVLPSHAATNMVRMGNYYFTPTNLTINAGDSVLWTNIAATAHDTSANSGLWSSPTFGGTTTYTFKFTNAGYYPYFCAVHIAAHPEQTGTVSVLSIGNVSPTASLTSPTNGASFTAPASITLIATAGDSDGSVTNVEFFNGATLLGNDTSSPYSFAWSSVPAGTYTLRVKATDNRGATATSAAVTITVTNSPPTPVTILSPAMNGPAFAFSFLTQTGRTYSVQFTPAIAPPDWQTLTNLTGNGATALISDLNGIASQRFYRVGAQ